MVAAVADLCAQRQRVTDQQDSLGLSCQAWGTEGKERWMSEGHNWIFELLQLWQCLRDGPTRGHWRSEGARDVGNAGVAD